MEDRIISYKHIKSREVISAFVYAVLNEKEVSFVKYVVENSLIPVATTREDVSKILGIDYIKTSRAVDMFISRLNRKMIPFGLRVKSVYNRGYFMEIRVAEYASTII